MQINSFRSLVWRTLACVLFGLILAVPSTPVGATESARETQETAPAEFSDFLVRCTERVAQLKKRGYAIEPLVATLPDPLDTSFGREFDLLLAAMVQAFEEESYSRDIHCLPWDTEAPKKASAVFRNHPGMIVFRKSRDPRTGEGSTLVPVLLVGESPVVGVHTAAMHAALRLAYDPTPEAELVSERESDRMATGGGAPEPEAPVESRRIRILGPTFSASPPSLNMVLTEWRDELVTEWDRIEKEKTEARRKCRSAEDREESEKARHERVRVVIRTGSATGSEVSEKLTDGLPKADGLAPGDDPRFVVEEAVLTSASNLDLMSCAWNFLLPGRLGLDTQLTGEAYDKLRDLKGHACIPTPEQDEGAGTKGGTDNPRVAILVESSAYGRDFKESGFHVVPFPMHVWRLREIYESHQKSQDSSRVQGEVPARDDLPAIELTRRPRGVPTYGGGATLASQEAVLRGILQELAQRRFEVIGVVASDVMDKRFLVEQIRTMAPGSRIVTFEKDLLLARSEPKRDPIDGVLVVSSFATDWAPSSAEDEPRSRWRSRFSLDASEGVFLATQELLGTRVSQPHESVWLSVTGHGELHTLQEVRIDGRDRATESDHFAVARDSEPEAATTVQAGPTTLLSQFFDLAAMTPRLPRGWVMMLCIFTATLFFALAHVANRLMPWRQGAAAGNTPPAAAGSEGPAEDPVNPANNPGELIFGVIPVELVKGPRWKTCGELPDASDRVLHALVVLLPVIFGVPYLVLGVPAISEFAARLADGKPLVLDPQLTLSGKLAPVVALMFGLLCLLILILMVGLLSRTTFDAIRALEKSKKKTLSTRALETIGVFMPLLVTLALTVAATICAHAWIRQGWLEDDGAFFIRRSLAPSSGASPLLPALTFGGILLGWVLLSLFRHRVRRAIPTQIQMKKLELSDVPIDSLRAPILQLRKAIDPAALWQGAAYSWPLLVATPLLYLMLYYGRPMWFLRTLERAGFDATVSILFVLAIVVSVGAGISLRRGWSALRKILEWLRLQDETLGGCDKWHDRVRSAYRDAESSRNVAETRRREALKKLRAKLGEDDTASSRALLEHLDKADEIAPDEPMGRWLVLADWRRKCPGRLTDREGKATPLGDAAREFFSWSVVRFVRDAFTQLLMLMGFMTAALLLILVAVGLYPFEPQRLLTVYISTLVAVGATLSIWIVLQARREKLLGALEGDTAPWQVLAGRLSIYAGLPILSVVANRVPELRKLLFDWLKPVLEAFG